MHHYGKFLSADGPPVYEGVGLVRTVDRGNELAAALGKGPVVLLRAHGDAVVGESVEQVIEAHNPARDARRVESSGAAAR